MVTFLIFAALTVLVADALYTRGRLSLRRRTTARSQRAAWDVAKASDNPWRPLDACEQPEPAQETDLSALFGRRGGRR